MHSLPTAKRANTIGHPFIASTAFALLLAVSGPVAAEEAASHEVPAAETAAASPAEAPAKMGTEIERFCSNIADAARDRRYALQTQELSRFRSRSTNASRCLRKSVPNMKAG